MNKMEININNSSMDKSPIGTKGDITYNESNSNKPSTDGGKTWWEKYGMATIIVAIIMATSGIVVALINKGIIFSNQEQSNVTVKFATSKNMWCGLGLIASDKGFFEDEGLDVQVTYLDAGRYCLDALVSNSTDFATIVEVNISYFGFTGNKSVIDIASMVSSTSSGIIALKSKGITKPEDLKGKSLAFSPGTTSDIFANKFIEKHGILSSEVNFQKIQPLAMTGAVTSGSVDAASTWDPHIYNISKILGDDAIVFRDPDAYTGYLTLAVREDWAYKNKDIVISFLKALKKAEKFAKEQKEEAQIIISRMINLDIEIVKATWDLHNMELVLDKEVMLRAVNSQAVWITNTMDDYKGKSIPDYSNYFDTYFLNEINK